MISTVILFWLFVTIVAVSSTWTSYLGRLASEKTIRQAIDKGLILDPDVIQTLRPTRRPRWDIRLIVPGIIIGFGGVGIALFAAFLAIEDPEALFPVLSIACVPIFIGVGFIVAGVVQRRLTRD